MAPDMSREALPAEARRLLEAKGDWHRTQARLPLREKVRILLELQRQELPLVARHRPLRSWERPWPIEP